VRKAGPRGSRPHGNNNLTDRGSMKTPLIVALLIIMGASRAWGTMGEYAGSVMTDQRRLHAQVRETVRRGYSIIQLSSEDGMTVSEYVAPGGLVFGVAWRGPTMPDLRGLLGSYFDQVEQAAQSRRQRRGPMVLRTKNLVLVSGGHMRSLHGIAYAPNLLPAGVSAEVVR
jgi:Protein of unknown function (DUF2844)